MFQPIQAVSGAMPQLSSRHYLRLRRAAVTLLVLAITATGLTVATATTASAAVSQTTNGSYSTINSSVKSMAGTLAVSNKLTDAAFFKSLMAAYAAEQVVRYTNGSETRSCHVDGRFIAGIYQLTAVDGFTLEMSDTNRWCDWTAVSTSNSATSYHWSYGGGAGLDIKGFVIPASRAHSNSKTTYNSVTYTSAAKRADIATVVDRFLVGAKRHTPAASSGDWQVGQKGCSGYNYSPTGIHSFADSCDHIHISYAGNDRTYPKPGSGTTQCYCSDFSAVTYNGGVPGTTSTPPPTTPPPTSAGWGAAEWELLANAIGVSYNNDSFGRGSNVHGDVVGSYSAAAKALQNFLNRYDTASTSRITADGYWGRQTNEKLVSFMYAECGRPSGSSGAMDGFGGTGQPYTFSSAFAQSVEDCLRAGNFKVKLATSWPDGNWARLHAAISSSTYNGDQFGRASSYSVTYGTASTSASRLQSYLNAIDNGTSGNLPTADGLWGPQTTEKLVAVLHDICGYGTDSYGAIDGKKSSGAKYVPTASMMNALATCINKKKFN